MRNKGLLAWALLALAAGCGSQQDLEMRFALDQGADGCAKKKDACVAARLLGDALRFDDAGVVIGGARGALLTGDVSGPIAVPTTIVVAGFEERGVLAGDVRELVIVLRRSGAVSSTKMVAVPALQAGGHAEVRVELP